METKVFQNSIPLSSYFVILFPFVFEDLCVNFEIMSIIYGGFGYFGVLENSKASSRSLLICIVNLFRFAYQCLMITAIVLYQYPQSSFLNSFDFTERLDCILKSVIIGAPFLHNTNIFSSDLRYLIDQLLFYTTLEYIFYRILIYCQYQRQAGDSNTIGSSLCLTCVCYPFCYIYLDDVCLEFTGIYNKFIYLDPIYSRLFFFFQDL